MGGDRLPAGGHRGHPALGQARRPVRTQAALPDGHRHLPHRLRTVRHGAEHAAAHRVPRPPGPRRRRADGAVDGDRRRHRHPARTRQVPGPVRRGVRGDQRAGTAARRLLHRAPQLALGLLHQPASRRRRAARHRRGPAHPGPPHQAHHRLPRHLPDRLRRDLPDPRRLTRRDHLGLGLGADRRPRRPRRGAAGRLRRGRAPRGGAGSAAEAVQAADLQPRRRHQLRHRLRDVRSDDLPADLPPGRPRHHPDPVRCAHAAHGPRPAAHLHRLRPDRQPYGPLEGLPDQPAPPSPSSACSCSTHSPRPAPPGR